MGNSHPSIMAVLMTSYNRVRIRVTVMVRVSCSFCNTVCISVLYSTFNDGDMHKSRCKFLIDFN